MNIQKIRDNLINTINGKQALLDQCIKSDSEFILVEILQINLQELRNILHDVELCIAG